MVIKTEHFKFVLILITINIIAIIASEYETTTILYDKRTMMDIGEKEGKTNE